MLAPLLSALLAFAPPPAAASDADAASGAPAAAQTPSLESLAESVPPRHIEAIRTRAPIVVDGEATDEVWSRAPVGTDFVERTPGLGDAPPLATRFSVAYDDAALYVLVVCEVEGPEDMQVRTLRRDSGGIYADDTVTIKLDPHFDRRSAVTFGANVDGAQIDSMALEDGRVWIREWDAVWQVETSRHEDHYILEYRIPFAVLGLSGGAGGAQGASEALSMGLDLSRDHARRNATYDWRVFVPPRSPASASAFGTLGGIRDINPRRAIEYTPFLVTRTDFSRVFTVDPRRVPNLAVGADLRVQAGKASFVEGSFLTDFAQVEVDEVQIARDRFPLFFPERRPFFINGLDVFNFGAAAQGQLFFSRRIGLDGGVPIPIIGGAKGYGRAGIVSWGVLNVQTMRSFAHDPEDDDFESTPPENFTVGRLRVQTGRRLILGGIATGKARFEEDGHDVFSGGIDAELRSLDGKLRGYGFVATTWRETPASAAEFDELGELVEAAAPVDDELGASARLLVQCQGLYVRPELEWLWSDEKFQAPLGFYRRPGTARNRARVLFAPRPRVLGLRDVQFGPVATVETTPSYDELLTVSYGSDLSFNWNAGWQLRYEVRSRRDEVRDPFELYLYTIDPKLYSGQRHRLRFETPGRLWIRAVADYAYEQAFGGETHSARFELRTRFGKHFAFEGSYTQLLGYVEHPDQRYNFGFFNGTVDVAFTRWLHWDTLLRGSFAPNAERFGMQSRVRWRYRQGSDLFVVYRADLPLGPEVIGGAPREPFHEFTVKLSFYLRALLG